MSRTFFTADTHFGHGNIVRMCSRPFVSIEDHDRDLIAIWNGIVRPEDTVYHLGDFAHKADVKRIREIYAALNGTKILLRGNHDLQAATDLPWSRIADRIETKVDDVRVVLDHYPMVTWNGVRKGAIQLYGHVHGRIPPTWNSCDVGVDAWGYQPVTVQQIVARLAEQRRPTWREPDEEDEDVPAGP